MTFKEAADWLKLVNEMPNASNLEWRIEELFQRDIDWKRVEKSIVPYLNTDGPKFFNSLTKALMPMINNEIKEYGADVKWHAPKLEKQSEEGYYDQIKTFGPVTCGYFGSGFENPDDIKQKVGHLCWNPDEICGVANEPERLCNWIALHLLHGGLDRHNPIVLDSLRAQPQRGFLR